jgi:hypothetical protein
VHRTHCCLDCSAKLPCFAIGEADNKAALHTVIL